MNKKYKQNFFIGDIIQIRDTGNPIDYLEPLTDDAYIGRSTLHEEFKEYEWEVTDTFFNRIPKHAMGGSTRIGYCTCLCPTKETLERDKKRTKPFLNHYYTLEPFKLWTPIGDKTHSDGGWIEIDETYYDDEQLAKTFQVIHPSMNRLFSLGKK